MSVLFIGQRHLSNYNSPYFCNNNQVSLARRQRKIRQEQYRLDLMAQMREKQDRLWRQRQNDHIFSRRYEKQPFQTPSIHTEDRHHRALSYHNKTIEDPYIEKSMQKIRQRQAAIPYQFPSTFTPLDAPSPLSGLVRRKSKIQSRLKTQSLCDRGKSYFQTQMAEIDRRRKELERYDNRKIGEVYEKMQDSVRMLKTDNNADASLPLKSSFEDKYKNLFVQKEQNNPEEKPQSQKLPPLSKPNDSHQQSEVQRNWREWFAKQKLRQLQAYYNKLTTFDVLPLNSPLKGSLRD